MVTPNRNSPTEGYLGAFGGTGFAVKAFFHRFWRLHHPRNQQALLRSRIFTRRAMEPVVR